ncbi:MAG: glycosyltransferase [Fimbriimonadales bacterium]
MSKIALYLPSLRGGGAERVFTVLAQGFAQRGYQVDMVLARAEGSFLRHVAPPVKVVDLEARRVILSLPRLVRYLRQSKPDVLLSGLDHANAVAILASKVAGLPQYVAVSVHNTLSIATSRAPSSRGRLLVPLSARLLYRCASAIVATSRGVAEDLEKMLRLAHGRVRVIYNPIVSPELLERAVQPIDHPWFQPNMPPVILAAGRLTEPKDFATLLRAFGHVRKTVDARLVILGEGEQRSMLEQLTAELNLKGYVDMPGFVENPYAYMKRAAVFALSSRWEGFGNVLVEAMACGTPVVATDCPSGPREILEDGKWGKLVPVGNPEALAEAIIETLKQPPQHDPAVRAMDFSLEKAVEAYLDALGLS